MSVNLIFKNLLEAISFPKNIPPKEVNFCVVAYSDDLNLKKNQS